LLDYLAAEGLVVRRGGRSVWIAERYAADGVSLRTGTSDSVVIHDRGGAEARVIGQMDAASAPGLLHEGAVYMHEGQLYLVTRLDWEQRLGGAGRRRLLHRRGRVIDIDVLETYEDDGSRSSPSVLGGQTVAVETENRKPKTVHSPTATARCASPRRCPVTADPPLHARDVGYGQVDLPQELQTTAYRLWFPECWRANWSGRPAFAPND
jgi:hypothetical protein